MKFVGTAQESFNSFMALVRSRLDIYCPHWNNHSDPRSYILPPIFSFKNSDIHHHQDIEKMKTDIEEQKKADLDEKSLDSVQRSIIDRCSDSAQFVVFYALWTLIQDKTQAPFLVIHELNFKNIEGYLQEIFPHVQVDIQKKFGAMMQEYDFVLIGPKIGLIVIEVESSYFTEKKDFVENKHLPDDIIKALEKLGSFDHSFFHMCAGIETEKVLVRKILFTPNLEKCRFETWLRKLDVSSKEKVTDKFNGVVHWFNEDMNCEDDQKPPLYNTVHLEVQKSGYQIPHEIFESYALIVSGIGSAVVFQNRPISPSIAISNDAALESQNPKKQRLDKNAAQGVEIDSKLILLTPEQQQILNGPNRQFIIGAPGTGKTILLQAKVAQLLKDGKKVLIFTDQPYVGKYIRFFNSLCRSSLYNSSLNSSCRIYVTENWFRYHPQLTEELEKRMSDEETLKKCLDNLSEDIMGDSTSLWMHGKLSDFDSILIDDALDKVIWNPPLRNIRFYQLISLMVIARTSKFRSKVVWIASDSYLYSSDDEVCKRILTKIIQGEQGTYFSTAILNRVMRSTDSVFQAIYSEEEIIQHMAIKPIFGLGNKIHGFSDSVHLRNLSPDDALLEIWKQVDGAVKKFKEEGFDYGHIAVLIGGERHYYLWNYLNDKFRENGIRPVPADACGTEYVTVDNWRNTSSHEWPVVIYIAIFGENKEGIFAAHSRYRACSRATMKFFEITVDVETDSQKVDFYRGDDALYILDFHNRAQDQINVSSEQPSTSDPDFITDEEHHERRYGGELFRSIVWGHCTIYKFDLKEIPGVGEEFLNVLSASSNKLSSPEQNYLEARKQPESLDLDDLEEYCRRGERPDLVEFIIKAKNVPKL